MKKILIIALLLMLIAPALALPDVYDQLRGRQMVGDKGSPWYADNAINYFGTGKDAALTYNPTFDKLFVNDTDVYLEEDVTIAGNLGVSGTTISNGKTTDAFWVDDSFYVTNTSALNVTTATTVTATGTVQGADVVATDDMEAGDDIRATGDLSAASVTVNSTGSATVTTADKLTVGGVIVPQAVLISIPLDADITANGTIAIPIAGNYQVIGVSEAHSVAVSVTPKPGLTLVKCTGTQAPATAGTVIMSNKIDLGGAASTIQTGALHTNDGTTEINTTERLGLRLDNPVTGLAGGCLSILVKRIA